MPVDACGDAQEIVVGEVADDCGRRGGEPADRAEVRADVAGRALLDQLGPCPWLIEEPLLEVVPADKEDDIALEER